MGKSQLNVVYVVAGESLEAVFQGDNDAHPDLVVFSGRDLICGEVLLDRLWQDLQFGQTSAVEAVFVSDSVFREFESSFVSEVIAAVGNQSVVAFSGEVLHRNLNAISESAGANPSARDISVILNALGQTSLKIVLPKSLSPIASGETQPLSQPARDWDSYIEHAQSNFQSFPDSVALHFVNQLEGMAQPSVLIDASGLPLQVNGTSRLALDLLSYLNQAILTNQLSWNITVLAPAGSLEAHVADLKSLRVINSLEPDTQKFDLGVTVTPITNLSRCVNIVRKCVRWVTLQLDIISIRSLKHLSQQLSAKQALEFINEFSDLVVSISETTKRDVGNYLSTPISAPQAVCHLGISEHFASAQPNSIDHVAAKVLVLGNDDPHKRTQPTVVALTDADFDVVSISARPPINDRHHVIKPGALSDSELKTLVLESAAVVFPSEYEGFGLPIIEVESLGKPIVAWNTEVNKELIESFGLEHVHLVSTDSDLKSEVQLVANAPLHTPPQLREMAHFHQEFMRQLQLVLDSPIDISRLGARWRVTRLMHAIAEESKQTALQQFVDSGQTSLKKLIVERMRDKLRL